MKTSRIAVHLVISLLVCAAPIMSTSHQQRQSRSPRRADLARFTATLDSLRRRTEIPGLAVAVVLDGRMVLARGFGFADLSTSRRVTEHTPFNIASVTKPLSAVVALRLVERGTLDLDRPLTSYRGFVEFCRDVRADGGIFFSDYRCDSEPMTLRHALSMTANGRVGTRFFYNPVSFSWVSRPMAEVTGHPFSRLVTELVFAPAGMTRSARIHRNLPLPPALASELAQPYHRDQANDMIPSPAPPPQGNGAAGGVVSTARDLARFDMALDSGRLVTPASREMMFRAGRSPSGETLPYGLGWYVQDYRGQRLVWHAGWWEQAYSVLYLKVPGRRATLILLANSEGLRWNNPLDRAEVEKSPFAAVFLEFLGAAARR